MTSAVVKEQEVIPMSSLAEAAVFLAGQLVLAGQLDADPVPS